MGQSSAVKIAVTNEERTREINEVGRDEVDARCRDGGGRARTTGGVGGGRKGWFCGNGIKIKWKRGGI